jgi:hypothetical protein
MPGPPPKHPSTRARANKTSTSATLRRDPKVKAPALPERDWHPMTAAWWADVWRSPMAPEFDGSDVHGLFALAMLVDDFWTATTSTARKDAAAEIRLQSQRFGLSPMDRRRLQWEIERSEEAQEKGARRRAQAAPAATTGKGGADPRSVLRAV